MTDQLLHGHLAFRRRADSERDYLRRLAVEGQNPQSLFIGCSDSRVIPELLTGANAGELFVVRNIANHVPPSENADSSVGAAIDYAVGVLGVQDVIVCGHSGCGGVRAALAGIDSLPAAYDNLREWVGNIVTAVDVAVRAHHPEHELSDRAVEANVLTSVDNLMSYGTVAARVAAGSIALHAWVYDLESLDQRVYDPDVDRWSDARALVAPESV